MIGQSWLWSSRPPRLRADMFPIECINVIVKILKVPRKKSWRKMTSRVLKLILIRVFLYKYLPSNQEFISLLVLLVNTSDSRVSLYADSLTLFSIIGSNDDWSLILALNCKNMPTDFSVSHNQHSVVTENNDCDFCIRFVKYIAPRVSNFGLVANILFCFKDL